MLSLGVTLSQFIMKSEITVKGRITHANIISPVKPYGEDNHKFHLSVEPFDYYDLETMEQKVERFKEEEEHRRWLEDYVGEPIDENYQQVRRDRITDRATIIFESLFDPHLYGSLRDVEEDYKFIGMCVKVKGHIQVLKDGNAFLSFHLVDEEQDPIEQRLLEIELAKSCSDYEDDIW